MNDQPRANDLATVADRTVADATGTPPDNLPDDPRAYLAWLRDPARPTRRPKPRAVQETPAPNPAPYGPLEVRDPAYATAATKLAKLPDLGGASLEAAQQRLDPTASWEQLVIDAAAHPVIPPSRDQLERRSQRQTPATTTPSCTACGTALEPDQSCFTCATAAAKGVAS